MTIKERDAAFKTQLEAIVPIVKELNRLADIYIQYDNADAIKETFSTNMGRTLEDIKYLCNGFNVKF